jgi:hypothetical protein
MTIASCSTPLRCVGLSFRKAASRRTSPTSESEPGPAVTTRTEHQRLPVVDRAYQGRPPISAMSAVARACHSRIARRGDDSLPEQRAARDRPSGEHRRRHEFDLPTGERGSARRRRRQGGRSSGLRIRLSVPVLPLRPMILPRASRSLRARPCQPIRWRTDQN